MRRSDLGYRDLNYRDPGCGVSRGTRVRVPFLLLAFLLGAGLLAVAPGASAGENPTKIYRDPVHKFSLKIFNDWEQVPIEAGEETEVAKWGLGGDRGLVFSPKMRVVRVLHGDKKDTTVTPGDNPGGTSGNEPVDPRQAFRDALKPKSAWDATIKWLNTDKKNLPPEDKFKRISSSDDVDGKAWEFEVPIDSGYAGQPPEILFAALASFEKDGVEYGIFFTCAKNMEKKYKSGFEQVAKSFKFFDAKAGDVESLACLDGLNISAKRRRDIERSKIKGWDVIVSPKKNYVVIYNTKNGKNVLLAKVISERIEQIREQVYEKQFPPSHPITKVSVCRICKDREEYFAYGGPGGSAGYWNSEAEELVFYDASPSKKPDDDTLAVLYHEAFHQYIYYSVGEVAPHSWFNEGHGDYYAGAKYRGGKFVIGPFSWRVGVVKGAIIQGPRTFTLGAKGEKVWGNTGYTPLQDLVRFSQSEYYAYPSVSYAQGWSLIYFLREIVPKNKKWNEKWGKILDTYFNVLKAEVNKEGTLTPGSDKPDDGPDAPDDPTPPEKPSPPDKPAPPDGPTPPDKPAPPEKPSPPDGPQPPDGGDPNEPQEPMIPQTFFKGLGGDAALNKAIDEAFKGIDWDEFEKAWKDSIKGVSG
jgi:hypothetical protein